MNSQMLKQIADSMNLVSSDEMTNLRKHNKSLKHKLT